MKKADIPAVMAEALEVLRKGGVILYPTDTIWGIGCDATDPDAVKRIYGIKRRSDSKSLVLLANDLDMVARYITKIPDVAIDLVEVNDKPMTIIYPGAVCSQAQSGYVSRSWIFARSWSAVSDVRWSPLPPTFPVSLRPRLSPIFRRRYVPPLTMWWILRWRGVLQAWLPRSSSWR